VTGRRGQCRYREYVPSPGSFAERAIWYLQSLPPGTRLSTRELAEALNSDPRQTSANFKQAVDHGFVSCIGVGENPRAGYLWGLGEKELPERAEPEPTDEGEWPVRRIVKASEAPMTHKLGPSSVFDLAEGV
jgi:hypothetical protein